ncbi:DUF58 domain-containing protein [Bifidobacterium psychraerophilum]|jgi:uncharacterized protein (DUF58 family)|uniref:DUF58 domain-containing protein n=1 Tax=Bifidobacterium psychraerophilum TaxID=218140 RepID=A0A087CGT8_9BIFI|nr:DUF58 domain-containing protein [Bifidobacterium psychraerophilum]KFI82488.1 hypothetical protein BPSY_1338 [Bifidobacterium psychraerophilum]MCI1660518.1 DUF58 domain-containing protein [Bifidobacterium psychraerophilum]MCI1805160.1 DUF58 domain-containing protein [Bifidobacterium psychraerophilum]MCI2175674.1 DUF58 domain-containing protein [Bifidobacterium psychraerophilum]MCI2181680.1 DUF58 domain-containing protein [Bifidobacterium psychraerophilum]
MSSAQASSDPVRRKIEALGIKLSLPTVRKALGVLEGEHLSHRSGGTGDTMDIRAYESGDEARFIDWKSSARAGRPMIAQRERLATSRVWMLLDVGREMSGSCMGGERAIDVAANALAMFASLCLRRSDDISLVLADAASITRMQFSGGFTEFEHRLDNALQGQMNNARHIDALLDYANTIQDRNALVVLATDETALGDKQLHAIRKLAQSHPVVVVDVATINPFSRPSGYRHVVNARDGRRMPAFLAQPDMSKAVENHREFATTALRLELDHAGSTLLHCASSELMFTEFIRIVSSTLTRSSRNLLRSPKTLNIGGAQ